MKSITFTTCVLSSGTGGQIRQHKRGSILQSSGQRKGSQLGGDVQVQDGDSGQNMGLWSPGRIWWHQPCIQMDNQNKYGKARQKSKSSKNILCQYFNRCLICTISGCRLFKSTGPHIHIFHSQELQICTFPVS